MPKISVIIPTYNRSAFMIRAINSVLQQTFTCFELIIVDDFSTDNTTELVTTTNDKRIKYIRNNKNLGVSEARNIGIRIARGEFIAFLDDDDEWLADKLEKQFNIFKLNNNIGMVYSGYYRVNNPNASPARLPEKQGWILRDLLRENCIGGLSSVMVKTDCFKRVGLFDSRLSINQDWDMYIRIAKEFEIKYVKEPLFRYHYHASNISKHRIILADNLLELIKKHNLYFLDKKAYIKNVIEAALLYCKNGNLSRGRKLFRGLLAHRIYSAKLWIYYIVSLFCINSNWFNKMYIIKKFAFKLGITK